MRRWLQQIADLPEDVVYNLPRVTLLGGMTLTVENHHGIITFSPQSVCFKAVTGTLTVYGEDLRLRRITPEDCLAAGVIRGLRLDPD